MLLASASISAISTPTLAQVVGNDEVSGPDNTIIVQARRRDEDVQDVPAVVDSVTSEQIAKLNFRDFREVQNVVPGLELTTESNGVGGSAKLRGVNFDVNASGFNATVQFYMNDAPITAGLVLQQMFDVGQIDVQRGPQGTLRGIASPSGSITVTTRKPDLYEAGGTVDMTANDIGTLNFRGAFGLPIIEGIAAIRVAGVIDQNELNRVKTINSNFGGRDPSASTEAGRVSAIVQPADWLKFEGVYQHMDRRVRSYDQVASFSEVNPAALPSPVYIDTSDRLSDQVDPTRIHQKYNIYNWRVEAGALGQQLIYQGGYSTQDVQSRTTLDSAVVFPGRNVFQDTDSRSKSTSHEVRLQNQDRLFDFLDYVVGYFQQRNSAPTDLLRRTAVRLPVAFGGGLATIVDTPIERRGVSKERSFFGNLTAHLGSATEISGGLRHIDYESNNTLAVGGPIIARDGQDEKKWIYTGSIKHNFSPDFMVYASTGSSFRPGINVVGNFNIVPSALERSFSNLPAETSKSYEVGFKSTMLDGRMNLNVTAYHQTFKNYPYRPTNGVFFVNTAAVRNATGQVTGVRQEVAQFNFVGAVPVEVNGVEGDLNFKVSDRWNLGLVASYSLGKIKDGTIPCTDINQDGNPDLVTTAPTLAALQGVTGANNLSTCQTSIRSGLQAPFSASLQSEYRIPISDRVDGYLRGLASYNGKSQADPTSRFDNVGGYALVNLYAGIRDPEGNWEVALFAKNLFETEKALSRGAPLVTNYQQLGFGGFGPTGPILTGPTSASTTSTYTGITMTPPREFGLNVRYSFGSR
ncbi:iron complex outermembrane receptor protein [Novosphingobium chloroacetimidivorans]|uniref:Iron complex outermembrane receptor protein n=1 Tax=Novosphingobium chloroacetimidivorans TaxID=1428314 RepID=A0A7W7NXK0_9SPHN|nr:TonB-dependent receptor [Novosphingobium chloroacetimidivorans]MBB4859207.1 iron complex outermembrane receptor protein [Novosphingobium chloroacetimidivorans]